MRSHESNKSKIVKAGAGYTIGNYMIKGLTFFSIPIFSRLLTPSDYGIYNTYIAYEGILCMCVGLTLNTCQKYAKNKYGNLYDEFVSSCTVLVLLSAMIWLVLINVFDKQIEKYTEFSRIVVNLLILHCTGSALLSIFNVYLSLSYSYKRYLILAGINTLLNIFLSVVLITTVFDNQRALGRIAGTAIPILLLAVYICYYFWNRCRPPLERKRIQPYWRFALAYSVPLIPHGISQVLLSQFDRLMIKNVCGAAQAGIYSFGYNLYTIVAVTTSSLDNVWSPWFFEKAKEGKVELIRKRATQYAILVGTFVSVIILISPELVALLGTEAYSEAKHCVVPILVGGYFSYLYTLPVQVQYYRGKTKIIAAMTAAAAVLNILLNALFIPLFGYVAAAYTTAIAYALYFVFHAFMSTKTSREKYFDWGQLFLCICFCLTIAALSLFLMSYGIVRWVIALILSIFLIIYGKNKI